MDPWLADHIVCPRDRTHLRQRSDVVVCDQKHDYPVVAGIPVLLTNESAPTLPNGWRELKALQHTVPDTRLIPDERLDPFVQRAVPATNGYLYRPLAGKLPRYPIPELRLPAGNGQHLLDIGCNWGRWTLSAALKGYRVIGLDPQLSAILSARRVSHQLGVACAFVVGDARSLPFCGASFDRVFSYSVVQHFAKPDALATLSEVQRVLAPEGESLIQMPNKFGIRCLQHQLRLRSRPVGVFDVRYWAPDELLSAFTSRIGPTSLSVDGYFGLGIQTSDVDLLPRRYRMVVQCSDRVRSLCDWPGFHWLLNVADSLYVRSRRAPVLA